MPIITAPVFNRRPSAAEEAAHKVAVASCAQTLIEGVPPYASSGSQQYYASCVQLVYPRSREKDPGVVAVCAFIVLLVIASVAAPLVRRCMPLYRYESWADSVAIGAGILLAGAMIGVVGAAFIAGTMYLIR